MMTNKYFIHTLLIIIVSISLNNCADGDDDDAVHELTVTECNAIHDSCKAFSESVSEQYQCIYSEPASTGCQIETEGYYYQTYYECAKKKAGSQCRMLLLGEKKCLATCYYDKIGYGSKEQAEEECAVECINDY